MRANYWSLSRPAKLFAKVCGLPERPGCATSQQWKDWKAECKKTNRVAFWIIDDGINKLQDLCMWPFDMIDNMRYYISNRFVYKTHYLSTGLQPGKYYEIDDRLINGIFQTLVNYVERECAHMYLSSDEHARRKRRWIRWTFNNLTFKPHHDVEAGLAYLQWEISLKEPSVDDFGVDNSCPPQAATAEEVLRLYNWWTKERPVRPDPYDVCGWTEYCAVRRDIFTDDSPYKGKTSGQMLDELHAVEQAYFKEDEEMMIRVIKLRSHLWT